MHTSKSLFYLLVTGIAFNCIVSCNSKPKETAEQTASVDPAFNQSASASARPAHWGYEGEDGPDHWASLSPAYALCAEGKGQSPVNISKTNAQGSASWKFDYKTTSLKIAHTEHMEDIIDNGHTIQITVDEGSTFTFGDKTYELKQFHFHTPSEHTVDGEHMPMEMHMVHQSDDESLAVVSVLFKEGNQVNENFAKITENLPDVKGETKYILNESLELNVHLPKDNYAYHYIGSLTTPPCSENVQWMVLREMVSLTANQINAFSSRIGPNNRPVQSLNDRLVEAGDLTSQ